MEGLILDTEMPIFEAWRETYAAHGHELSLAVYRQCVGSDFANSAYHPDRELEKLVGRELDWPNLRRDMEARVREIIAGSDPLPGVVDLLEEAHGEGIPCVVASSSTREWVGGWLEKLELMGYFEGLVNIDDVDRPKPSPELFLHAARRLQKEPDTLLIFEDSLNGLRAARAAEIHCVIAPNPVTAGLPFEGAFREVESLEHVDLDEMREELRKGRRIPVE